MYVKVVEDTPIHSRSKI